MKRLRIYLDTSVVGGCLDAEFQKESSEIMAMARRGEITLLISSLLEDELEKAPVEINDLLGSLPVECLERVAISEESSRLRNRYMEAEILGKGRADDALHVALATVSHADLLVSWNFRHIVHFDKIRQFNAVNLAEGYSSVEIRSPKEVV